MGFILYVNYTYIEIFEDRIIYDIRNPNYSHNTEFIKERFCETLQGITKQLRRWVHKKAQSEVFYFDNQADLYSTFKSIFKRSLFDSVPFRQICHILWTIFREYTDYISLSELPSSCLYSRVELFCCGKAVFPDLVEINQIDTLGYFPLHRAIFENQLSVIRKLLINQV